MAHPGGRPPKLTDEERAEVYEALERYILNEDDPTVVGFVSYDDTAIKYSVTDDNIGDWQEFSGLRKRAIKKQEAYLLKFAGSNRYNPTIAIFRLKQPQHGYTDRSQVEQSGEVKHTYEELNDEQLDAAIKAREARISETT